MWYFILSVRVVISKSGTIEDAEDVAISIRSDYSILYGPSIDTARNTRYPMASKAPELKTSWY